MAVFPNLVSEAGYDQILAKFQYCSLRRQTVKSNKVGPWTQRTPSSLPSLSPFNFPFFLLLFLLFLLLPPFLLLLLLLLLLQLPDDSPPDHPGLLALAVHEAPQEDGDRVWGRLHLTAGGGASREN